MTTSYSSVPLIAGLDLLVSFEAATAVARAERAIEILNEAARGASTEAARGATVSESERSNPVGAMLLRAEAAASSRLAGDVTTPLGLAMALRARREGAAARGRTGAEAAEQADRVAANARAIEAAIEAATDCGGAGGGILAVRDLERIDGTVVGSQGRLRKGPTRIAAGADAAGGRAAGAADAADAAATGADAAGGRAAGGIAGADAMDDLYVAPAPGELPKLVDDLLRFVARTDLPALAQAAVAHAQLVAIRPFEDGNGRTARALFHHVLRRRGLTPDTLVPVSIALAARPTMYRVGLAGFREGGIADWALECALEATRIAETCTALVARVRELQEEWRTRAGNPRNGSAAARIIELLPAHPVLTAGSIKGPIGASHQRSIDGLARLADAGVLRQIGEQAYDRTYVADELFALDGIFALDELADLVDVFDRLVAEAAETAAETADTAVETTAEAAATATETAETAAAPEMSTTD